MSACRDEIKREEKRLEKAVKVRGSKDLATMGTVNIISYFLRMYCKCTFLV